jgi:hypothetical protein
MHIFVCSLDRFFVKFFFLGGSYIHDGMIKYFGRMPAILVDHVSYITTYHSYDLSKWKAILALKQYEHRGNLLHRNLLDHLRNTYYTPLCLKKIMDLFRSYYILAVYTHARRYGRLSITYKRMTLYSVHLDFWTWRNQKEETIVNVVMIKHLTGKQLEDTMVTSF